MDQINRKISEEQTRLEYETAAMQIIDLVCESRFLTVSEITIKKESGVSVDAWGKVKGQDDMEFFNVTF